MLDLYPAIDLRGGNAVRLTQGDFDRETVYDADPVAVARRFERAGATWIHVVDLDAARSGRPAHLDVLRAVRDAVGCRVQAGGGVRSAEAAATLLEAGVDRVVVGTAAVERPELVDDLAARHPGRVAVGLDARGAEVAVRGWVAGSGAGLVDLARRFDRPGVGALVVTEIGRDGTLAGPDLSQLASVLGATSAPVVASGGVGTLDDLRAVASLELRARRPAGVIVGRALYEGRFTLEEALAACRGEGAAGA
ncbi:MAG: 1-(5-phosphoribosyl)-5-[(5-phosphoribosylamino)methylideneamino]imidazole-4-carboxamide isomerase [Acidimicrobiia bacterium]|nr:1-(5-phosphoribosyl)-5-[(5-phosphoribosylamino)methylideneamino]imidazole-4-carboxamide isomerase [Acidimicrobiia bacterium]MCL4291476.1 1-(5-phosphoribosyl)-5-[(5-phosphoribosylamino)methylideneamino]imidazole-4-carboxamide isomerase [Acidimicrobiia bacterium]